MSRAMVNMLTQIGVEATKGIPVTPGVILTGTSFETGIQAEVNAFRPLGQKYNTVTVLNREWVEAGISGIPSYDDLTYLLAAILRAPTSSQQGATTAYRHTYTLAPAGPDLNRTFTVQQGDPSTYAGVVLAHTWNYSIITELGLEWRRTADPTLSGRLMGRGFAPLTATMATGTRLAAVPISPGDVSIFLDPTLGSIGTTRLLDVSRVAWRIANRYGVRWTLNSQESSWVREVELPPELTLTILMGADDVALARLANMRQSATVFLQISAASPVLAGTGHPYSLQLRMAGKISGINPFEDDDGFYAVEWTFTATPELTTSSPCTVELVGRVTAV